MVDQPKLDSILSNLKSWDVDDQLVASYLRDSLGDFDRFATAISAALQ